MFGIEDQCTKIYYFHISEISQRSELNNSIRYNIEKCESGLGCGSVIEC